MGHLWMGAAIKGNRAENRDKDFDRNCVRGRQGSPQGTGAACSPAKTPGSSMKIRAVVPVASGNWLSGAAFRIALFAVLAVIGWSSVSFCAESARSLFKRGQAAEAREDYDAAYNYYQQANAKDPKDLEFRASLYRIRISASGVHLTKGHKLQAAGNDQGALVEFLRAAEIDPGNEAAQQEIARARAKDRQETQIQETSLPESASRQEEIDSMWVRHRF